MHKNNSSSTAEETRNPLMKSHMKLTWFSPLPNHSCVDLLIEPWNVVVYVQNLYGHSYWASHYILISHCLHLDVNAHNAAHEQELHFHHKSWVFEAWIKDRAYYGEHVVGVLRPVERFLQVKPAVVGHFKDVQAFSAHLETSNTYRDLKLYSGKWERQENKD